MGGGRTGGYASSSCKQASDKESVSRRCITSAFIAASLSIRYLTITMPAMPTCDDCACLHGSVQCTHEKQGQPTDMKCTKSCGSLGLHTSKERSKSCHRQEEMRVVRRRSFRAIALQGLHVIEPADGCGEEAGEIVGVQQPEEGEGRTRRIRASHVK